MELQSRTGLSDWTATRQMFRKHSLNEWVNKWIQVPHTTYGSSHLQVNILHGHLGVKSWVQMRGYSNPHPTAPGAAQTARFIHSLSPCPITPHNLTSQLSLILQWRTRGSRKANIQLVRVRARFCKRTRDPPPYTHSCSNERRINVPSFNSRLWISPLLESKWLNILNISFGINPVWFLAKWNILS